MKLKAFLLLVLRLSLALIFIVSGFQKLTAPYQNFVVVIEKFELLKGAPAQVLALSLPWVEFVVGIFFALGLWTRLSLFTLWSMNTVFIVILTSSLLRKLDIQSCGCFGEAVTLSVPQVWLLISPPGFYFFCFFSPAIGLKHLP